MTILKQAAFSIAFAVLMVALAKYAMWILEQKGLDKPVSAFVAFILDFFLGQKAAAGPSVAGTPFSTRRFLADCQTRAPWCRCPRAAM
jgi:hypothetical protein